MSKAGSLAPITTAQIQFDDNALMQQLCGQHDAYLARIEQKLGVSIVPRGNILSLSGAPEAIEIARTVLSGLYERLRRGAPVDGGEVDAALRMAHDGPKPHVGESHTAITTRRRSIQPRSPTQADYVRALTERELVFGIGPAGTGKTYLAVAAAVAMMMDGKVDRIILSRPAVEAGERLGFLPGDLKEKIDPYLRPLYDALYDMMPADQVARRLGTGEIEIAPLAFMRGRTLANAFVILDEAQNTTPMQMKMFLTRLGENSRMAITGDLSQIDLPGHQKSGLSEAAAILEGVEGVSFVRFTSADVVRHPLVVRIVQAYEEAEGPRLDLTKGGAQ